MIPGRLLRWLRRRRDRRQLHRMFEALETKLRGRMCSAVPCRTVNLYRLGMDPVSDADTCVKCGAPLEPFDPPLP